MSCVINIGGIHFDIDSFLKNSTLKRFEKYYKGDLIDPQNKNGKKRDYSYITKSVSLAGFDQIDIQIEDSISFIHKYEKGLSFIKEDKNIDFATIEFRINQKINNLTKSTQLLFFPANLISLCGKLDLGLEVSIHTGERDIKKKL